MKEDYISRQAIIRAIDEIIHEYGKRAEKCEPVKSSDIGYTNYRKWQWIADGAEKVKDCLSQLPSVQPKEKTGHWVNAKVGKLFPSNDYKCSECGNILDFDGVNCGRGDANYCPNCGARMVSK